MAAIATAGKTVLLPGTTTPLNRFSPGSHSYGIVLSNRGKKVLGDNGSTLLLPMIPATRSYGTRLGNVGRVVFPVVPSFFWR